MEGLPQHRRQLASNTIPLYALLVMTQIVLVVASILCVYLAVYYAQCDDGVRSHIYSWHDAVEDFI